MTSRGNISKIVQARSGRMEIAGTDQARRRQIFCSPAACSQMRPYLTSRHETHMLFYNYPRLYPWLSLVSSNQYGAISHKMEDLQIKTLPTEPDIVTELMDMLEVRRDLRREYRYVHSIDCGCGFDAQPSRLRNSCLELIHLFGPTIFALVVHRCQQRDARLVAEAAEAVGSHMMVDGTPRTNAAYAGLKTQLELETILCTEYRCAWSPSVAFVQMLIHQGICTLPL